MSFFFLISRRSPRSTLFPYTTLFRSDHADRSSSSALASWRSGVSKPSVNRSEEHTSELQSPDHIVCRLLLEKKKIRCRRLISRDLLYHLSGRSLRLDIRLPA